MKRCAICDYLEGHGSDWLGHGPTKRYVAWNSTHREFQCSECFTSIKQSRETMEVEDALKAIQEPDVPEGWDEVSEVPATLSPLPF